MLTYEEYVAYLCKNSNMTREQLFAQMEKDGRVIVACDCDDYADCQGWQCRWPDAEEEMATAIGTTAYRLRNPP
jgi:hypothetical protein